MKPWWIPRTILQLIFSAMSIVCLSRPGYAELRNNFLFPFQLSVDPMQRLLIVNLEQSPDILYKGYEPQYFDDPVNGSGFLIVAWRNDGWVDVYHQRTLSPDAKKFSIAAKGLSRLVPIDFEVANFQISASGVHAEFRFKDIIERETNILIDETNTSPRKTFSLLAPMGHSAENPPAIPLFFLHEFYFVRKQNTRFIVTIAGREHSPDLMPLWFDGSKMYFSRYSNKPLIALLNPEGQWQKAMIKVPAGRRLLKKNSEEIFLCEASGKLSLCGFAYESKNGPFEMDFTPPFPDIRDLNPQENRTGNFTIRSSRGAGTVSGNWRVENRIQLLP